MTNAMTLGDKVRGLKRTHPATCPRAHVDEHECFCGADAFNARVKEVAAEADRMGAGAGEVRGMAEEALSELAADLHGGVSSAIYRGRRSEYGKAIEEAAKAAALKFLIDEIAGAAEKAIDGAIEAARGRALLALPDAPTPPETDARAAEVECPTCGGSGRVLDDEDDPPWHKCGHCRGTGSVLARLDATRAGGGQ
jgi:hypothetical protein